MPVRRLTVVLAIALAACSSRTSSSAAGSPSGAPGPATAPAGSGGNSPGASNTTGTGSAPSGTGGSAPSGLPAPTAIGSLLASPASLTATTSLAGEIDLRWSPGTGDTATVRYLVQRSFVSNGPSTSVAQVLANGTSMKYQDLRLSGGAAYFYKVVAVDANGVRSPPSNEAAGATPAAAVRDLHQVSATTGSVTLAWTSEGATQYQVARGPVGGPYTAIAIVSPGGAAGDQLTYTQTSIPSSGTRYGYVVASQALQVTNPYSNEAVSATLPKPPVSLSAAPSGTGVLVNWTAPAVAQPAVTEVEILRSTSSTGVFTRVGAAGPSDSSFQDEPGAGTTFFYKATATDIAGASAPSTAVSALTIPAVLSDVGATASLNVATVTWTPAVGATGYKLYRSLASGGPYTLVSSVTAPPAQDGGIAGTDYYYVVLPFNASGAAANSNEAHTTLAPPPAAGLTAAVSDSGVVLKWSATRGATSYDVGRGSSTGGPYTTVGSTTGATTFTDAAVTAGATYYYVVTAKNAAGSHQTSNEAAVTVRPPAPAGLVATAAGYNASLAWSAPSGAVSYSVYRSTSSGAGYALLGTSPTASFLDSTAPWGGTYFYVVTATNAGGTSANSNESATTILPGPATALTATGNGSSVGLSWTAPSGATSFTIYRSGRTGGGYTSLASQSGTTYSDAAAPAGCTCFYVVTATNAGGTSGNSNEASATVQPATPGSVTATANGGSVALAWNASAGATRYNVSRSTTSGSGYVALGSPAGTGFTDSQASAGGTYYYVVSAANAGGTSANSPAVSATVLPGAPGGLSAVSSGASVALTWTATAGATGYTVSRSTTSGTGYAAIATPAGATFTDSAAPAGGTYYYIVSALNAAGTSAASTEASATIRPDAISDLTATAGAGGSVSLSWSAKPGATGYSVFRGTSAGGEAPVAIGTPLGNAFTDSAASAGSTAYYVVTAGNAGGASANSNETSLTLKPAAIADLAAASGAGNSVSLTWTASPGATSYSIYRGGVAGGESAIALGTSATNSFSDTTPVAGSNYFYVVSASNAGGTSLNSNEASTTRRPAPIADLTATVTSSGIHLSWSVPAGATGYSVFRGSSAGTEGVTAIATPAVPSFDDANGAPGSTWFYVVTAGNAGGNSDRSNEASITLQPSSAANLTAAPGAGTSVSLSWAAVPGATSYSVYRGSATGNEAATALATSSTNSFNDATTGAGGTYYYFITSTNAGGTSARSNEANLTLKPAAIGDLAAAPAAGAGVSLSWSAASGATRYNVYRGSTAAGEGITAVGVPAANSFTDTTAASGSTFYYVVTATNAGGSSANSNEVSLTLKPAQIQDLVATASGTSVTLSWTPAAGATGYSVYSGATAGGESPVAIGSPAIATFQDSSLLTGTAYYYTVVARNAAGASAASNEVRAVTVLPPPTGLAATVSVFDVSLSWTASNAAKAYDVLRSTSPTGGFTVMATVTGTSYCNCETTAANLRQPNTTYYYEVVARSTDATSAPSTAVSITTAFPAPTGVTVSNTGTVGPDRTRLAIAWNAVAGAATYSLQRALRVAGPFTEIAQPGTTFYTDSGLALSTTYFYRVLALSGSGPSPASAVVSRSTLGSPWQPGVGLNGGEIKALAFDPTSSGQVAYAAVRGGAGVYKSVDGGQTWTASGSGLGSTAVAALAWSSGKLIAGTFGGGMFTSGDGGASWTASNSGLPAAGSYLALAADLKGSGVIYLAAPRHVYKSIDNGDTWQATALVPAAPVIGLAIDPNAPARLYATTDGAGLLKTTDSGATWATIAFAGQSLQGGVVIDPANASSVRVGTAAGVQASADGGATWALQGSIKNVRSLALTGTTLYAGTNDAGVYSSVAGGAWTATNASAAFLGGITALAASGAQVLAGSYAGHGIFHSSNAGAAWSNATAGIAAADATAIAISADASELFAVGGHQLLKSVDHGATWTMPVTGGLPYPVIANAVAVDPSNASVVYVGSAGVQRSIDGGATFRDTGANFSPSAIAIPAQAHNLVYAAIYNGGVYVADFSAASPQWRPTSTGITDLRLRSIAVDPSNAQNLFAGGEGGLFRSTNGGATWTSSGLTFVRSVTAVYHGQVFAVVGAGASSNLQKSLDGGATFAPVNFGTSTVQNLVSVAVDSITGQTVYAVGNSSNGSQGGLYKSTDGGATWTAVKAGLPSSRLHRVLIDPTAIASLYLASEDSGVLTSGTAGE